MLAHDGDEACAVPSDIHSTISLPRDPKLMANAIEKYLSPEEQISLISHLKE